MGMGTGVAVFPKVEEPTEDGTGGTLSSKKSWLCGEAPSLSSRLFLGYTT